MTDIKVGDRVRATSKTNDDTAEFTVVTVTEPSIQSDDDAYSRGYFDFEVIKPALPTEPGIYAEAQMVDKAPVNGYKKYLRTNKGEWYFIDFTAEFERIVMEIPKSILSRVDLVPVYV